MFNTPGKYVKYTNFSLDILFLRGQVAALGPDPTTWQLVHLL